MQRAKLIPAHPAQSLLRRRHKEAAGPSRPFGLQAIFAGLRAGLRSGLVVGLVAALVVAAPGCKDEDKDDIPQPTAEQIARAKAKAKARKARKTPPAADAGRSEDTGEAGAKGSARAPGGNKVAAKGEGEAELSPAERRLKARQERLEELRRKSEEQRKRREGARKAKPGETAMAARSAARRHEGGAPAEPVKPSAEAGARPATKPAPRVAPAGTPRPKTPAAPGAQAARAAAPRPPAAPVVPPLEVARFLSLSQVRSITGSQTLSTVGTLAGIDPTPRYNSLYFAPPRRADFGVAIQVWKEATRRDANERFRRMRRDYPNAEDTSAVTPKGMFSYWGDMMTLAFLDFSKKTLVAITCSQKICDQQELYKLALEAKKAI